MQQSHATFSKLHILLIHKLIVILFYIFFFIRGPPLTQGPCALAHLAQAVIRPCVWPFLARLKHASVNSTFIHCFTLRNGNETSGITVIHRVFWESFKSGHRRTTCQVLTHSASRFQAHRFRLKQTTSSTWRRDSEEMWSRLTTKLMTGNGRYN